MDTKVYFERFGEYSGPRILGTSSFNPPSDLSDFWGSAVWLTSAVESGAKFGAITMYDGTACTAGLHQAIAVYPKELAEEDCDAADDQGSFFSLLQSLDQSLLSEVTSEFTKLGWKLDRGNLVHLSGGSSKIGDSIIRFSSGSLVHGALIRNEFTPIGGQVTPSGPSWEKSKKWALTFHRVFSSSSSFSSQIAFGRSHLITSSRKRRLSINGSRTPVWDLVPHTNLSPAHSLAMAVLWSHSVNAPSIAFSILEQVLSTSRFESQEFPRNLIRSLGTRDYGRWRFSIKNGRYDRTRKLAMRLWPSECFVSSGVMPANL